MQTVSGWARLERGLFREMSRGVAARLEHGPAGAESADEIVERDSVPGAGTFPPPVIESTSGANGPDLNFDSNAFIPPD
jgi:hypothetical protein